MTIHEYISTYTPRLTDFMVDPEFACQELRQEGDALALKVGLPVSSEGRYSIGLWDIIMGC